MHIKWKALEPLRRKPPGRQGHIAGLRIGAEGGKPLHDGGCDIGCDAAVLRCGRKGAAIEIAESAQLRPGRIVCFWREATFTP